MIKRYLSITSMTICSDMCILPVIPIGVKYKEEYEDYLKRHDTIVLTLIKNEKKIS